MFLNNAKKTFLTGLDSCRERFLIEDVSRFVLA